MLLKYYYQTVVYSFCFIIFFFTRFGTKYRQWTNILACLVQWEAWITWPVIALPVFLWPTVNYHGSLSFTLSLSVSPNLLHHSKSGVYCV